MEQRDFVLWIASWYPSVIDPLEGDFIQRHAMAVSKYYHLTVWSFIADKEGVMTKSVLKQEQQTGQLTEIRVYYYTGNNERSFIGRVWKVFLLRKIGVQQIMKHYKSLPKPLAIHAHIILYAGYVAGACCKKWNIPLILSEQWTGYLHEAVPNYRKFNPVSKSIFRDLMKQATAVTAVSQYLANRLQLLSDYAIKVTRIANVVNPEVFKPGAKQATAPRFITVTANSYQKNVEDVIEAALAIDVKKYPFELLIVSHQHHEIENELRLKKAGGHIKAMPPMPQGELANLMGTCKACIMYSRYETFGCVAIEAMAAGVPVIASDIPVLHEIIRQGVNGWFVAPDNYAALSITITAILKDELKITNMKNISTETAAKYGYDAIGKQFAELYKMVLFKSR